MINGIMSEWSPLSALYNECDNIVYLFILLDAQSSDHKSQRASLYDFTECLMLEEYKNGPAEGMNQLLQLTANNIAIQYFTGPGSN